jgi:hypothetical protein
MIPSQLGSKKTKRYKEVILASSLVFLEMSLLQCVIEKTVMGEGSRRNLFQITDYQYKFSYLTRLFPVTVQYRKTKPYNRRLSSGLLLRVVW